MAEKEANTDHEAALRLELKALRDESKKLSREIGRAKNTSSELFISLISKKNCLYKDKILPIEKELEALQQTSDRTQNKQNNKTIVAPPALISDDNCLSHSKKDLSTDVLIWSREHSIKSEWENFCKAHPGNNIYYSWNFLESISETFKHSIYLVVARNTDSGALGAILPIIEQKSFLFGHLWTSIPFVNYGGPLSEDSATEGLLLEATRKAAAVLRVKRIEIRGLNARNVSNSWILSKNKASMWLSLPRSHSSDELISSFKAKLRSQIKKGYTSEIKCRFGREELVDDFYKVFARNMRDLGTPVYSKRLFSDLLAHLPENSWIHVIYHRNTPVAVGFLIKSGNAMEIPWASAIRDFNRFNVNMVLYWEALKFSCQKKCDYFDYGRSTIGAPTYQFKKQWGCTPIQHYWYGCSPNDVVSNHGAANTDDPKFELLIAIWQKLPIWLTKILGPSIVKNIP
jgi:FemAB-related protein (PEP-CTERM system-associated)